MAAAENVSRTKVWGVTALLEYMPHASTVYRDKRERTSTHSLSSAATFGGFLIRPYVSPPARRISCTWKRQCLHVPARAQMSLPCCCPFCIHARRSDFNLILIPTYKGLPEDIYVWVCLYWARRGTRAAGTRALCPRGRSTTWEVHLWVGDSRLKLF